MAENELAACLARRQNIIDGVEAAPAEHITPKEKDQKDKDTTDCADSELASRLKRQTNINDGLEPQIVHQKFNPYTEFKEYTRQKIKEFRKMFDKYDTSKDGFIDLQELKYMTEKLEAPQTHYALKSMIKEVDEDNDGQISFREFLLIFRKADQGDLEVEGLEQLARLSSVDVSVKGVGGAKNFFEAKVNQLTKQSKFE